MLIVSTSDPSPWCSRTTISMVDVGRLAVILVSSADFSSMISP
jgi:hypothetical protein